MLDCFVRPLAAVVNGMVLGTTGIVVSLERGTVSITVFIASIVASVGFTWAVARWNHKRDKRIDDQFRRIEYLEAQIAKMAKAK